MLTVLYSPHMTSVDNETGHASGHADVPLSAAGRSRARALGLHYADEEPAAVYCSDLRRAWDTARIAFAGRAVPIVPDARLREYDYGELTRCAVAQVEGEFARRIEEPFPGGESLAMVVRRVGEFLREAVRAHDGRTIVVIGHRASRNALEYWCGTSSLAEIVATPWEWREVPIWRYVAEERALAGRARGGRDCLARHPG
jgi:alpha-ribazole phosphatase/probable phosphoglycerate mutase